MERKTLALPTQCSRVLGVFLPLSLPGSPLWHSPGTRRFPAEGPYDAAKTLLKPISRRKHKLGWQQPHEPQHRAGSIREQGHRHQASLS